MGAEPPFLYDAPSRYSFNGPTDKGFNPRAATHASWTPAPPKPQKDGPLIEFNRHPDSYLVLPYGQLNVQPMPGNTKSRVKTLRMLQLTLRLLELIGALGSLFCVIAISNVSGSVAWIIRVAPAVALVHTVYAVYHLCRASKGRTPGSTASYMVFAAMLDTGLIPFMVFSALMAHGDYTMNAYHWSSLFGTSDASYKVIYSFFLVSVTEGSLMVVSLILGIYLAVLFRKISKLPPDMNPLEPNLTSRPHKRNKSELPGSKEHLSGSTYTSSKNRLSNMSDSNISAARRVPFMHTRTDSADSLTLYNQSARGSRIDLDKQAEFYKQGNGSNRSGLDKSLSNSPSRPASAINPASNARQPGAGVDHRPVRSSVLGQEHRSSWLSFCDYEGVPAPLSTAAENALEEQIRSTSPVSPISPHLNSQLGRGGHMEVKDPKLYQEIRNWYESPEGARTPQPHKSTYNLGQPQYFQSQSQYEQSPGQHEPSPKKRSRDPLGMNPPSPYIDQENHYQQQLEHQYQQQSDNRYHQQREYPDATPRQALHETDTNRPQTISRTSSFVGSGTKSRFYGNLQSSIGSVNNHIDNAKQPPETDNHSWDDGPIENADSASDYSRTQTGLSESSGNIQVYPAHDEEPDLEPHQQPMSASNWQPSGGRRDMSNSTGFDLRGGYAGLGQDFGKGMGRRREVSGKVAEEGRCHEDEAKQEKQGAAGWARFKGL